MSAPRHVLRQRAQKRALEGLVGGPFGWEGPQRRQSVARGVQHAREVHHLGGGEGGGGGDGGLWVRWARGRGRRGLGTTHLTV